MKRWGFTFVIALLALACSPEQASVPAGQPDIINQYLAQYAPYEMHFDASGFSEREKNLLKKLIEASHWLDTVYWMQISKYGLRLRDSLANLPQRDSTEEKLLTLLNRNTGPFELLNEHAAFMGNETYYPGHEVYPRGMTAEQFDAYVAKLPKDQQDLFMNPYTVIREDDRGGYKAVWYHDEYKSYIDRISQLLNEAADLAENDSFKKFLRLKSQALQTDHYFDADVAWIDMEGSKFDMVFGPFETYADGIKGIKAMYESYIEVVDQEESKRLEVYTKYLNDYEQNLPVPAEYKSEVKGLTAKFAIVRDIIRKGEGAAGYQAVATNLPNDPVVHEKKGTKKTFWKNMFDARFNVVIKPVSLKLIAADQQQFLSDGGFFQFVLMHEICHAVGPRVVKVGPKKGQAVNAAIGPLYSALEECKADITGLHSLVYLMDKGVVDKNREKEFFVSYLGSEFRSVRFGLNEAHGKAAAIGLNYLLANRGITYDSTNGIWSVDFQNIRNAIKNLAGELVVLEGDGDATKVQAFFDRWAKISPEIQAAIDKTNDIAIDVLPQYSIKWD